ncbi:MAG: hypothetical protein ACRDK3_00785 [Actinomycetota bacterium]
MSQKHRTGQGAFNRRVDGWILEALDDGARSFEEILLALPGVFPLDLARALQRLKRGRRLSLSAKGEAGAEVNPADTSIPSTPLPVPHPLDYDWRFAEKAVRRTLDACLQLSATDDAILFLGTPTTALAASGQNARRKLRFVEWNVSVIDVLAGSAGIAVDHIDVLNHGSFDHESAVVLIDPPWYRDHMRAFMWAATQWCVPGGHIVVSMPPVGTRPEMEHEHDEFRGYCAELGLHVLEIEEQALPYLTPPFEINALRASGIDSVPIQWRRGDLWILRREHKGNVPAPPSPAEYLWHDHALGAMRFKTRAISSLADVVDPRLTSLVDGDICSAVSRHHPLRNNARVWTSGNRVYGCASPSLWAHIATALRRGQAPVDAVAGAVGRSLPPDKARHVRVAAEQMLRISELERKELISLGHDYGSPQVVRSAS